MAERGAVLVTGGSRGIGAAVARRLAADGFDIWLNFRSGREAAEGVREEVLALGRECLLVPFDVADPAAVKAALEPLLEKETPFGLVNNAGFTRDAAMVWMKPEDWHAVLAVHLDGFFNVTQALLMPMLKRRCGRIVNIVSTSGQTAMPGQVNYSAAKAGLIGATRTLAAEVAKRGVLVNAVSPGFIDTEMTRNLPADQVLPRIPAGRMGTAAEVAEAVSFLMSGRSSYITGQVLAVNGGTWM